MFHKIGEECTDPFSLALSCTMFSPELLDARILTSLIGRPFFALLSSLLVLGHPPSIDIYSLQQPGPVLNSTTPPVPDNTMIIRHLNLTMSMWAPGTTHMDTIQTNPESTIRGTDNTP